MWNSCHLVFGPHFLSIVVKVENSQLSCALRQWLEWTAWADVLQVPGLTSCKYQCCDIIFFLVVVKLYAFNWTAVRLR